MVAPHVYLHACTHADVCVCTDADAYGCTHAAAYVCTKAYLHVCRHVNPRARGIVCSTFNVKCAGMRQVAWHCVHRAVCGGQRVVRCTLVIFGDVHEGDGRKLARLHGRGQKGRQTQVVI